MHLTKQQYRLNDDNNHTKETLPYNRFRASSECRGLVVTSSVDSGDVFVWNVDTQVNRKKKVGAAPSTPNATYVISIVEEDDDDDIVSFLIITIIIIIIL